MDLDNSMTLDEFISRIPNLATRKSSEIVCFFAYYLEAIMGKTVIKPSDISECFLHLKIPPYSNIPQYLQNESRGQKAKFIKKTEGYVLSRSQSEAIAKEVSSNKEVSISTDLIDINIFSTSPKYILVIVEEMAKCYEIAAYNATLILMRKIIETLIIECFEKYGDSEVIKDAEDNFLFLNNLISRFITHDKWNVSRNLKNNLTSIKRKGDLSAHNRRFIAQKADLDKLSDEFRQLAQEMILIIGY